MTMRQLAPWLCVLLVATSPAAKTTRPIPGRAVDGLRLLLLQEQAVMATGAPTVMRLRLVNGGDDPVGVQFLQDALPDAYLELTIKSSSGQAITVPAPRRGTVRAGDLAPLPMRGSLERPLTLPFLSQGTYVVNAIFHQHLRSPGASAMRVWEGDIASNTVTLHIIPVKTQPKR